MPRKNIPLQVDKLADKLINDNNFYPNKSKDERAELAYKISWNKYREKKSIIKDRITKLANDLKKIGFNTEAIILEKSFKTKG